MKDSIISGQSVRVNRLWRWTAIALHDPRTDENSDFGVLFLLFDGLEHLAEYRDSAKPWNAVDSIDGLALN